MLHVRVRAQAEMPVVAEHGSLVSLESCLGGLAGVAITNSAAGHISMKNTLALTGDEAVRDDAPW